MFKSSLKALCLLIPALAYGHSHEAHSQEAAESQAPAGEIDWAALQQLVETN